MACNLFLTLYLLLLFFIASLKSINILRSFASIGIISYVPLNCFTFFFGVLPFDVLNRRLDALVTLVPVLGERFVFALWLFLFIFCSVLMA